MTNEKETELRTELQNMDKESIINVFIKARKIIEKQQEVIDAQSIKLEAYESLDDLIERIAE